MRFKIKAVTGGYIVQKQVKTLFGKKWVNYIFWTGLESVYVFQTVEAAKRELDLCIKKEVNHFLVVELTP